MANLIIQPTIPTIYKKILKDGVSGEVIIRSQDFEKILLFIDGDLVFASTSVPKERLGEILFKTGKINGAQLHNISGLIKGKQEKVGKILVQHNYISLRELFEALKEQIKSIAVSLFSVSSGEWDFVRKIPEVPQDSRFKIRLAEIIVEGMAQMQSIPFFENQFYYQTPKTSIIPQSISKHLSDEDLKFYKELSAFSNLPSEKLIRALNVSEEKFWRKINLFYLLNILEFDETTGTIEDTKVGIDPGMVRAIREMIEMHDGLKAGELDYYELLGVGREVSRQEIEDAYAGLVEKYRPDEINATKEINEKVGFVFSEIKKAYETLRDSAKREAYDQPSGPDLEPLVLLETPEPPEPPELLEPFELLETPTPPPVQEAQKPKEPEQPLTPEEKRRQAKQYYLKGKALHEKKKFMEAALLLEKAVDLDNTKSAYVLLLGISQAEVPLLRRNAEENLKKAAQMEPWNAEPLYALGLMFQAEDMPRKAEVFFRKALELDVDRSLSGKISLKDWQDPSKKKSFFSLFGKDKK